MRIVQISGKGRVGKTTLAHLIAKYSLDLGFNPVIIPFAGAIKKLAEQLGLTKESDSTKYREFCQELGASKRKEDPDYWAVKTYEEIQEYMVKEIDNKRINPKFEYVIIQDDVRYMNELGLGRDLAALQIFISSQSRNLPEKDAEWRNHESEVLANNVEEKIGEYLDVFDFILYNHEGNIKLMDQMVRDNLKEWLDMGYLELEDYDETN